MSIIKKLGFGIAGLLIIALTISFFLPKRWSADESIVIDADKNKVLLQIAYLKNWENWTPWGKDKDPTAEYEYSGALIGEGSKMSWEGKKLGKGQLVITKAAPNYGIEYDIFMDNNETPGHGKILVSDDEEGGVLVTWHDEGEMSGFPMKRYMIPFLNSMLKKSFKEGLTNLKSFLEGNNPREEVKKEDNSIDNNNDDDDYDNDAEMDHHHDHDHHMEDN